VNYDEMLDAVASQAGLTRDAAAETIFATLTVLAERVTPNETRDLLAQLPKPLKTIPIPPQPTSFTPDEFVARVGKRTSGENDANGGARVRAVFSVLGDAVNAGEMRDIAEQLGDDYVELSDRPQPAVSHARQGAEAPAGAGTATAARGAGVVLDAARGAGGVACGLAADAWAGISATVARVPVAITRTLRHAGAMGARKAETVADAIADAADAIEDAAERAAGRFGDRAHAE
jgi:uncharacterized protein (DUF2267 family)